MSSPTPQLISPVQLPSIQLPGLGPVLLALLPNSGPTVGGNTVTLFGLGLAGTTSVLFGGASATIVGQDPLGLTVTVQPPAHAAGSVLVTATNGAGTTNPVSYTYVVTAPPATPTAAAIIPPTGPTTGNTPFIIAGSSLQNGTVTFGLTPATVLGTDPTGTVLFGITPAGPAGGGNVPVTVTTPGGSASVPGGYTYVPPAPVVTGTLTPVTAAAGSTFSIAGAQLFGATVLFGATPASGVAVNLAGTALTGTIPPGISGSTVAVTVQTAGGTVSAGSFTYL
ncbi:cell surface receptor IPT/TIG domain-containing protein [Streptomyces inhibens]|uniref:Cell surface receptor IPT/TIG domain-containing protein n=1 Tax=Streptomyces inhibens TaxID=2293571 RepID=A0A371PQM5_STRIH|nr:IPT/TIG domain-containing protein [Streptomyces inhibens]REK84818.1 cell surface receptor IPT/TIG domain-containing protein [Streptomyces inhibens]